MQSSIFKPLVLCFYSLDLGSERFQLFLEPLIAPVQMFGFIDDCLAVGDQTSQDERS